MIGVYDYTVILTYLSLLSAGTGIVCCLGGTGHPFIGIFFLLFCGLCDAFDGKVANSKKDRTDTERKFGIQIDSLSDLIAFGVLPACIGAAFIRNSDLLYKVIGDYHDNSPYQIGGKIVFFGILILYILAAMIRLAYFNVSEEERQETEGGSRKYYLGLPVTSAALIFPTIALLQYCTTIDLTWVYILTALITAILFVSPFKIQKFSGKGLMVLVGIGVLEFITCLVAVICK